MKRTAIALAVTLIACGSPDSGGTGTGPLRATVAVDYLEGDPTIELRPERIVFGQDRWATHDVTFAIWTDDYVQHFSLHDSYVLEDGSLVPTDDTDTDYVLSDDGPLEGSFTVHMGELSPGENRATLEFPVRLEIKPEHRGQIEPREYTFRADLVYDVYRADSPMTIFCTEADHLLSSETRFNTGDFLDAARRALDQEPFQRVEDAATRYEEGVTNGIWNPNEFFDLTEELCDVTYDERWVTMR